jgi:hypothetical protein
MTKKKDFMDEEKKPFGIVWFVLLVIIAFANDVAEVIFDLLAATGVGLVGEAIMEPVNFILDGLVSAIFIAKCGWGMPALIQLVDDMLQIVGVPGRTISVVAGILIANNPKSMLAKAAKLAAAAETGGAGELGEAEEAAAGIEGAAAAAEDITTEAQKAEGLAVTQGETVETTQGNVPEENAEARENAPEAETGGATEEKKESVEAEREAEGAEVRPGEEGQEPERGEEGEEPEEEGEDISATEAEGNPEDVAKKKLFEETPTADDEKDEDEDEESQNDGEKPENQRLQAVPDTEEIARRKAEEVKRKQQQLKKPGEITATQDEDTFLDKAA